MIVESPTTHSNFDGPISGKFHIRLSSRYVIRHTPFGLELGETRIASNSITCQSIQTDNRSVLQNRATCERRSAEKRSVSRDAESLQEKRKLSPVSANLPLSRRVYLFSRPGRNDQRPANTQSRHQRRRRHPRGGRSQRDRAT